MGRRNRKRRFCDGDENDDTLEREYAYRRGQGLSTKREKHSKDTSNGNGNGDDGDIENKVKDRKSHVVSTHTNNADNGNGNGNKDKNEDKIFSGDESKDKIERLRLKKKKKKELQKQKKKELAAKQQAEQSIEKRRQKEQQSIKEEKSAEKKKLDHQTSKNLNFITTHRGVQYCDIIVGKGPIIQDRKKVRVSYKLRAKTKTGKILDSSSNFGFRMGKGEVIPGWEIGLLRMRQGGTRHLIVPPGAGYGNRNIGAGSGALLYFEIVLLTC